MNLMRAETNNCIVTKLTCVRDHPNADRLKLATILGTQVVVGLDAKDGDVVLYFDSNLCLSHEYLHHNNLYSNPEMNADTTQKGYFPRTGRVKCQKFRGEMSNGYVAEPETIANAVMPFKYVQLKVGDEFTHVNDVKICEKYVVPNNCMERKGVAGRGKLKTNQFHKHWNTKQLMRESDQLVPGPMFIEEKVHGTSGRTANARIKIQNPWWKLWLPKYRYEYQVVSGTRRVDSIDYHMPQVRKWVHEQVAPHIRKGEELYYEIFGYDHAKQIQPEFPYRCKIGEYKVVLYRVTFTNEDGFCVDMDRQYVYNRAAELGLEAPIVLESGILYQIDIDCLNKTLKNIRKLADGKSAYCPKTLREGVVCWFQNAKGLWTCLKYKGEEFLAKESKNKDNDIVDCEDEL